MDTIKIVETIHDTVFEVVTKIDTLWVLQNTDGFSMNNWAAVFLGICSLLLLGYSIYLSRKSSVENQALQRATALPYLIAWEYIGIGQDGISIINKGMGPAIIESFVLRYIPKENEEKSIVSEEDLKELNKICNSEAFYSGIGPKSAFSPGEEIWLFKFPPTPSTPKAVRNNFIRSLDIKITYRSMYGNRRILERPSHIRLKGPKTIT